MTAYAIDGVVPVVDPAAFVHPDAVLIGDVVVEAGCYIGPGASLRGDMGRIRVGAGANIQDGCVLHCFPGRSTTVGPGGHVGHRATLHGCRVGTGALIGIGATVMDGANIGDRVLLGAHSLVPADMSIKDGYLAHGSPARQVRPLTDAEMEWLANGPVVYSELAMRSLESLLPVSPLPALPDGPRELAIRADRSLPLREFRHGSRP